MIKDLQGLEILRSGHNLLAFSSGVDSSALYFLLLKCEIPFDVAIVDYGKRAQSRLEISRAQNLCFLDNKKCFIKKAQNITKNFENAARKVRYAFFEEIIVKFNYTNLILAHQLNDAFEWFLMQFCKGTSRDYLQMQGQYKKQSRGVEYRIVRPLLRVSRDRILQFLRENEIFYFEDFSNSNTCFLRNYFRQNFSEPLLKEYERGIKFSLDNFLKKDILEFLNNISLIEIPPLPPFVVFKAESFCALEQVDRACKICGVLLTQKQKLALKKLLLKNSFSIAQSKIAIEKMQNEIFISPFMPKSAAIPKKWREKYRILRIPNKFRIFLEKARELEKIQEVLDKIQILRSENEKHIN